MGGIWAEVTLRYDGSLKFKNQIRPFVIDELKPIQLSTRSIGPVHRGASRASPATSGSTSCCARSAWSRSHPYFTPRRKLLYLARLIPLVERNYNLIELGPRGTGKSFVYQQISPYSHLISGGQTTVAQMFVNLATGQRGLVALWDTVAFDEAAGIRFTDKNGINIMKNYMEDGTFSRGREIITAEGSIVFVGNLDGDMQTIIRTSNLFYPMPKEMDTAFFDRIHAYLPGLGARQDPRRAATPPTSASCPTTWPRCCITSARRSTWTSPSGTVEFGQPRRRTRRQGRPQDGQRADQADPPGRQRRPGRRSPSTSSSPWRCAGGSRSSSRRWAGSSTGTSTSATPTARPGEQRIVGLPESGGGLIITGEPLPAGSVYTIGTDASDRAARKLALFLIQTQVNPGSGRIIPLGQPLAR